MEEIAPTTPATAQPAIMAFNWRRTRLFERFSISSGSLAFASMMARVLAWKIFSLCSSYLSDKRIVSQLHHGRQELSGSYTVRSSTPRRQLRQRRLRQQVGRGAGEANRRAPAFMPDHARSRSLNSVSRSRSRW